MSKSFKDTYYQEKDNWTKKPNKNYKQKRTQIKNQLKNINFDDINEDDQLDLQELLED